MMTDLRGFTTIAERLPAEDVLGIINSYLEIMTEIILKYQGTINEFIGDAILVLFGAPIAREDHAKRAVACALEMQTAMDEVNKRCREKGYPEVRQGIGINTGSVVVGNIGSSKRTKYGVVGNNVNLTSRIESYTLGGQILVSENTRNACDPILDIDHQMEILPKGFHSPVTIYEVRGIGGDFNIFLPERKTIQVVELKRPLDIRYKILTGIQTIRTEHNGKLIKLEEMAGEIEVEQLLCPLTNIKISLFDKNGKEVTSDLYAKIIENMSESPQVYKIHFTSVPAEAETFIDKLLTPAEKES
jgi:adenylate cyclase